MDVTVLGQVKASTNGVDHPLGGTKQRALLAHLVVARGRPVPAQRLIRELWDEAPPRDPVHALQARVSRLRSVLPVDVELVDGGYRLDATSIQIDAVQFEALCEEGGWMLADGELERAAEYFHAALALWHGTAFAGLDEFTMLSTESVRLESLRSSALSDRIDLDLALGHSASVVAELHALVAEQPFAERHWGQLMTALYCDNRAKEALTAFSEARSAFADGLGVEPSNDLGRLHVAILREHSPETLLRLTAPTADVDEPAAPGGRASEARVATLTSNQPDALIEALRRHRTLVLTGDAGIGKTHLLRAISAHFDAQHFSAPVLSASSLSQLVPLGVFAGQGTHLPQAWNSPATLIDHFSRHRSKTVLLVDNVDQLDDASLFVVTQLIRTTRIPTILTSRDLTDAPPEVRALYDSGDLTVVPVDALTAADADEFVTHMVEGPLTPGARSRIFGAANGNPLHLREVIAASLDDGRLVREGRAWELQGDPATTPRLTQFFGERFDGLDDAGVEGAAKVAIAGEYPADAVEDDVRTALSRAGVVVYGAQGWLRLSHPLDTEVLRSRIAEARWSDLTADVLRVLLSNATADRPVARRRAHILALDSDQPIDTTATLEVAEHALGTFNERLALRAAQAVVDQDPGVAKAHRLRAVAASALGKHQLAEESFAKAQDCAMSAGEATAVALARAKHIGIARHDAAGALAVLQQAMVDVGDAGESEHLRRDAVRWAVAAGQGAEGPKSVGAPETSPDAMAVTGLVTAAMSGVITGPLQDAQLALVRLRQVPAEVIEVLPGGAALIELADVMATSNTGDMLATRRRLEQAITEAQVHGADSLGTLEYALGFSELLSGDAQRSYALAVSASAHLEWRDIAGLLPAAQALAGAAAHATGRAALADSHVAAIPTAASEDPKVVMLRAWSQAWEQNADARDGEAARTLLDAARWLLSAQHTYFAGVLAHCAVRVGGDGPEAVAIIEEARALAGGGLLEMLSRHGNATIAGDIEALDAVARDARELGMATTAADTWRALAAAGVGDATDLRADHRRVAVDALYAEIPAMALWAHAEPSARKAIPS